MELASNNGLRPWQQEKHYIQSLVLSVLSEYPVVFKGGTYLWFFHSLGRFSEVLDFTATGKLPEDIAEIVSRRISLFGVQNSLRIIKDNELGISFRILAIGPLNTGEKDTCSVYIEISMREKVLLVTESQKLDFPGYLLPVKPTKCMNLTEVGAEKVRAILTRKKARDLYDLNHMITHDRISFNRELINEKLPFYGVQFESRNFMLEVKARVPRIRRELEQILLENVPDSERIVENLEKWIG